MTLFWHTYFVTLSFSKIAVFQNQNTIHFYHESLKIWPLDIVIFVRRLKTKIRLTVESAKCHDLYHSEVSWGEVRWGEVRIDASRIHGCCFIVTLVIVISPFRSLFPKVRPFPGPCLVRKNYLFGPYKKITPISNQLTMTIVNFI